MAKCRHVPDPASIQAADGAGRNRGTDWIVDVSCLNCGRSGSIRIDPADIDFDDGSPFDEDEPERERGEDDGREYGHPGDRLKGLE
jgi:hypothetical protein